MATTLAACELSGYSKSNHTFLWFSLSGSGFSSSLIKPSSSLCVSSKSNWNFISLALNFEMKIKQKCSFVLIFGNEFVSIDTNHSSNYNESHLQGNASHTINTFWMMTNFQWNSMNLKSYQNGSQSYSQTICIYVPASPQAHLYEQCDTIINFSVNISH